LKIAIHQPNFLPWQGFIDKLQEAEIFVLLDHVQFSKGGYTNRVTFNKNDENFIFTVPVSYKFGDPINKVQIHNWEITRKKLRNSLKHYYPKCAKKLDYILEQHWTYLIDLNVALLQEIMNIEQIGTKIIRSSTLNCQEYKGDLILEIMQKLQGTTYITGNGGSKYLDVEKFKKHGIEIEMIDFALLYENYSYLTFMENGL